MADLNTSIPGLDERFIDFGAVAIDPGKVVFVGFRDGGLKGLYTDFGGSLSKVIQVGDTLAGKQVTDIGFGPFGFTQFRLTDATTGEWHFNLDTHQSDAPHQGRMADRRHARRRQHPHRVHQLEVISLTVEP